MRTTELRALLLLLCSLLSVHAAAQRADATPLRGGFPEGQAAIDHVLVQIDRDGAYAAFPVYRDLARSLPRDVLVTVAVPGPDGAGGARMLMQAAGFAPARVRVVSADGPVTMWARDRVVALQGNVTELLTPAPNQVPLERIGDVRAARALAPLLPAARHVPTSLWFEGGNILCSRSRVFVGANALVGGPEHAEPDLRLGDLEDLEQLEDLPEMPPRGHEVVDAHRAADALQAVLGKDLVVLGALDDLPHEHIDMYLTIIDDRTVLLGDPALGAAFLADAARHGLDDVLLPETDQWTAETQRLFEPSYERIRCQLTALGLRVERLPILHGLGGSVLTWNNALVELREDGRRAYVPIYGIAALDERAAETYRLAGCRVFPIDASRVIELGGAVRCMVNVIGWREVPALRSSRLDHRPAEPAGT